LWNRLYAALYVRTADDGQTYGLDDLDPLLWENSPYLLTEPRYQQVLDLLNEFLNKRGEKLIALPLNCTFRDYLTVGPDRLTLDGSRVSAQVLVHWSRVMRSPHGSLPWIIRFLSHSGSRRGSSSSFCKCGRPLGPYC
jgi:hypothetical protein